jgi:class 3 adenylate cyclase/alpha-beta hydrolase superfamily lysophospholipase
MEWGPVEYARAGETHVAYRVIVGDRDSDLVIVMINGLLYPMEVLPEDPIANRLIEGLASLGTLVMFDRRGIGLSDQITDWDTHVRDQWVDDVAAVVDALGRPSVSVFSWHVSGTGRTFAARFPDRVDRLVLFNAYSAPRPEDRRWMAELRRRIAALVSGDDSGKGNPNPNRRTDPAYRAWQDRAGRLGASPSQAARIWEAEFRPASTGDDAPVCEVPTLVITRRSPEDEVPAEFLARPATELPDAELVVLPDGDADPFGVGVDAILAEISRYLVGEVRLPRPEREVRVIMFTDLVDSTRRAASSGDAGWRSLLDRHDRICERAMSHYGGHVVKSTGDGVLALCPSVSAAVDAACDIQRRLDEDDLSIRTGIHVGEVHHRGDDVSGMAVNIASRVMAEASPGQILLTEVAHSIGSDVDASLIGTTRLKGSDESWVLYEAVITAPPGRGR